MSKFLTTKNVIGSLEEIIEGAQERIVLISPYVFIPDNIRERLTRAVERKVDVSLITLQNFEEAEIRKWEKIGFKVYVTFNLHGKAYYNENEAIITSFNLIDSSERKNIEFGILIGREADASVYSRIVRECEMVIANSKLCRLSKGKLWINDQTFAPNSALTGFCIRCNGKAEKNSLKPYCLSCYIIWNNDRNNPEKYCNYCGKEFVSTYNLPKCESCARVITLN